MFPSDQRPALFVAELAVIAAIFWLDEAGYIPLSKTPVLLIVAWGSMYLRGVTWRAAGLTLGATWRRHAMLGLGAGVLMWAFEFFVTMPLLKDLTGALPDLTTFNDLVGNLEFLFILLAANIVLAVFGEEMVWRGYALPRVAAFMGTGTSAWIAALVVVNVAFGLAHSYQGAAGVGQNIIAGIFLGTLYLVTGRNLVAPMCAHFITNTMDFTVMYLGLYPGVGVPP